MAEAAGDRDEAKAPPFRTFLEKASARVIERYLVPTRAEQFKGIPAVEDLALYTWIRRLLKNAKQFRGREFRQRNIERPDGIEGMLDERVPQFFLRNIQRAERELPDEMEWKGSAGLPDVMNIKLVKDELPRRFPKPELLSHWNIDDMIWFRAMIQKYFHKTEWNRHFGHEIKEKLTGPIWKYDPDV